VSPVSAKWDAVNIYEGLEPPTRELPDDIEVEEGYLKSSDDLDLFYRAWRAAEPKAIVALQHGYAEHTGRYHHVAGALARAGFGVFGIDARGHGRSEGVRGHVDRWDNYVDDFDRAISQAIDHFGQLPVVVLGHSNGGLIALRHALNRPGRAATYVVTSPFCGLALAVPLVKDLAGRALSRVLPKLSMPTGLPADAVSHRSEVVRDYVEDPLVFTTTTTRYYTETNAAHEDLMNRAHEIKVPFLFLVAGDDALVDADATEKVYHLLGSAEREMEVFPELYHELLNEDAWTEIMDRMLDWIDRHLEADS
jgi:alpha-beta hydrolase superfamily lysophospholipase